MQETRADCIYLGVYSNSSSLNKQVQIEPMKICVTQGLAKSEILSEVVVYLVRVTAGLLIM